MRIRSSISAWHDPLREGLQYLATAGSGLNRRAVFTNEVIFQLAAMGVERIIVGVCQYFGGMPSDHTLSGLVDALAEVCPLDAELADLIKRIEAIDDMCTLTPWRRSPPGDIDVEMVLLAGHEMAAFARQQVPWKTKGPRQ
jgi:hypothetical protein